MRTALALSSIAALLFIATSASAQAVSFDVVLEPLVIAAQADLERGDLGLAMARAGTVAGALPPESAIAVRASGLLLLAQQRLGSAPGPQVDTDIVLTPLVDAAEIDAAAGRYDLARARLDVVVAHVPATAALAVRAASLRAAVASAPAPQPQQVVVAGPTGYAPASSVYVVPSGRPPTDEPPARRGSGTNWSLVAPGIGLLAGGWVIGWVTTLIWNLASTTCTRGVILGGCTVAGPFGDAILQMLVPILGPWWTIGTNSYRGNDVWFPGLIGVMQPVGLLLLIVGLVTPRDTPPEAGTVRITPGAGGLTVEGWF